MMDTTCAHAPNPVLVISHFVVSPTSHQYLPIKSHPYEGERLATARHVPGVPSTGATTYNEGEAQDTGSSLVPSSQGSKRRASMSVE